MKTPEEWEKEWQSQLHYTSVEDRIRQVQADVLDYVLSVESKVNDSTQERQGWHIRKHLELALINLRSK